MKFFSFLMKVFCAKVFRADCSTLYLNETRWFAEKIALKFRENLFFSAFMTYKR